MTPKRKPYARACEENGPSLLAELRHYLPPSGSLLEIGSGTGQHAVMFASALPALSWQTSDLPEMHAGINLWLDEARLPNLRRPIALDVLHTQWPGQRYDAVFSANTAHIMPQDAVAAMFAGVAQVLIPEGRFFLYGPFMYDGEHTSESNWRFDRWIRAWEAHRGLRDVTWLKQLGQTHGLWLEQDIEMPENNRLLLWRRAKRREGAGTGE